MGEEAALDLANYLCVAELSEAVDVPLKHLHSRGHSETAASGDYQIHGRR